MPDALAGGTTPDAIAHLIGKGFELLEDAIDQRHDIGAVKHDRPIGAIAQRNVEDAAILGVVDPLAGIHAIAPGFDLGRAGEIKQQGYGVVGQAVLRKIQYQIARAGREPGLQLVEALGICREEITQMMFLDVALMLLKGDPGSRMVDIGHVTTSGCWRPDCRLMPITFSAMSIRSAKASCGSRSCLAGSA